MVKAQGMIADCEIIIMTRTMMLMAMRMIMTKKNVVDNANYDADCEGDDHDDHNNDDCCCCCLLLLLLLML